MLAMRLSLSEPISEIYSAAEALDSAVNAHLSGDRRAAAALIEQANCPTVWSYLDRCWGKGARARYQFSTIADAPPYLAKEARPSPRMPSSAVKALVKVRDRHHCRFCGIPVIDPKVRAAMMLDYPEQIPWPRTDAGRHGGFACLWLQYDHILPNTRGGDSSVENIVLTCTACNFGRMDSTLEEGRLHHPLTVPRPNWHGFEAWDGLERYLRSSAA